MPDSNLAFSDPFALTAALAAYKFMDRDVPLTDADYAALDALMTEFCKVPEVEIFTEELLEPNQDVVDEWFKYVALTDSTDSQRFVGQSFGALLFSPPPPHVCGCKTTPPVPSCC